MKNKRPQNHGSIHPITKQNYKLTYGRRKIIFDLGNTAALKKM